jgi:cell division septum initiation protein DivIVA
LDEVAEFVAEKENELDDLDVAEQIGDLEARVDELEQEIEELEGRKREILNSIGMARTVGR